jgi:hypothetical protein
MRVWWKGKGRGATHISSHVDEAQSLADVEADDDDIRVKQTPVVWA